MYKIEFSSDVGH